MGLVLPGGGAVGVCPWTGNDVGEQGHQGEAWKQAWGLSSLEKASLMLRSLWSEEPWKKSEGCAGREKLREKRASM